MLYVHVPVIAIIGLAVAAIQPAAAEVQVDWVQPTSGISIAADADDNVYTVNYLYALGGDITLTKRSADGELLWEVNPDHTRPPFWERAQWLATDPDGNVVACGTIMSGFSNPVVAASAITKFSPDGEVLWRHVYESGFDGSSTRKCLVDESGNIYVLGLGFGGTGLVTKVKKFSPDGDALWSYFDADGIGAPINFKFTPDHQLVISGRGTVGSINGYARITLDGEKVWSLAGVPSLAIGDGAGDALGNTYIVHSTFAVNGGSVIRKLGPTGAELWSGTVGLTASRIEVGSDQQAVACGFPTSTTGGAAFAKVDQEGSLVWENLDADGPGVGLLLHAQMLMDQHNNAYLAAGTLFQMGVCRVNADGTGGWTALVSGGYANAMTFNHDQSSLFVVGGSTARLNSINRDPVADLNGDGFVTGADLGLLLGAWGPCSGCAEDLTGDGTVDGADLGLLLTDWTG